MASKMKRCRDCGQVKALGEFKRDARYKKKLRYTSVCLACSGADHGDADETAKVGGKFIPWHEDLNILHRLAQVSVLMVEGAKPYQIYESIAPMVDGYSWDTAKRDIERVQELRLQEVQLGVLQDRADAAAQYRQVILKSWSDYRKSTDLKDKRSFLALIKDTQRELDNLLGSAKPKRIEVGIEFDDPTIAALNILEQFGVTRQSLVDEFMAYIQETADKALANHEFAKLLIGAG